MKLKKWISLIVSSLIVIACVCFAGLYTYGTIGKGVNKNKYFIEHLNDIYNTKGSYEAIKRSVEIESKSYQQIAITLSENDNWYLSPNGEICASNGMFKILLFAKNYSEEMPTYLFYLYDVDYSLIDPNNLSLVTTYGETTLDHLLTIKNDYDFDNDDTTTIGGDLEPIPFNDNVAKAGLISKNILYDNGAKNISSETPYVHAFYTTYTTSYYVGGNEYFYADYSEMNTNYSFAIVDNSKASSQYSNMTIVAKGTTIPDITTNDESFISQEKTLNGFQNDVILAGYNSWIWDKILLTCLITLIITGPICYLLYRIWNYKPVVINNRKK